MLVFASCLVSLCRVCFLFRCCYLVFGLDFVIVTDVDCGVVCCFGYWFGGCVVVCDLWCGLLLEVCLVLTADWF